MLPACRTPDDTFAIRTFDVLPSDAEGFVEALWTFQAACHDCLARSEARTHFFDSMVGQCRQLERKSIEPLALQVAGGRLRGLQRFSSDGVWEEAHLLASDQQLVAEARSAPEGVLMLDETGCAKQGADSVGVPRPYCGALGTVDNCQVGVGRVGLAPRLGVGGQAVVPAGGVVDRRIVPRHSGGPQGGSAHGASSGRA